MIWLVVFTVVATPFLLSLALLVGHWRSRVITAASLLPLSALLLLPLPYQQIHLPWLLLETRFGIDPTAVPFILLAAVVWTAAGVHARNRLQPPFRTRFFLFWLLTWAGNVTVFIALDAAGFYTAFALMSLGAYALVVHGGTEADYRAGRVYLIMALIGEGLLIGGLIGIAREAGNVDLQAMQGIWRPDRASKLTPWLLTAGFAIKIGVVPLHVWLPLAHPQAPVPASAVLSGVMLKAGLVGWLRFLPMGFGGFEVLGIVIIFLGLFSTFYGALVGIVQQRAKAVLAYSSISQMGLMAMGCGVILLTPHEADRLAGVVGLFALHHGLAKGSLFLGVDEVHRHPRVARWLLLLPAASLAGMPLTSGLSAKAALKSSLPEALAWIDTLLMLSSFLTALILLRFFHLVWPRTDLGKVTWPKLWMVLLGCGIVLPPAYAWWFLDAPPVRDYAPQYLWGAVWPVFLAVGITALVLRGKPRRRLPAIPEGDVLAFLPQEPIVLSSRVWWSAPRLSLAGYHRGLLSLERWFGRISVATCLWMLLALAMLLLMRMG